MNIYHPRSHFIVSFSSSSVFTLYERRETSTTTSLLLIRTSSDQWYPDNSVFISIISSGSSLCSN